MDDVHSDNNDLIDKQDQYSSIMVFLIMILLSFVLFISLTRQGIVIPVFPLYVETFGGRAFQLGLLIGVFSLTSLILSPIIVS